jgi:bifunctional oligoribonuclease and PAP phosphatase NrnA
MDLSPAIEHLHTQVMGARRALITGPVDVDGDSIGASLALAQVLRQCNPDLEVITVAAMPIPRRYEFLEGVDAVVTPAELEGPFDLALLLDGVRHRIGEVGPMFDAARVRVLVDHHVSSDPDEYDLALLDVRRASTCEIVHELARHPSFDVTVDVAMAQQLYTGIAYDTGTFRYSCTTPATLRLAADLLATGIDAQQIIERVFLDSSYPETVFRGRVLADIRLADDRRCAYARVARVLFDECGVGAEATDGLINRLVFIEGVEVAFLLVERQPEQIKVSFRSRGLVNVAEVARELSRGGGGHDRAAGVTLEGPLDAVERQVHARIRAHLARVGA